MPYLFSTSSDPGLFSSVCCSVLIALAWCPTCSACTATKVATLPSAPDRSVMAMREVIASVALSLSPRAQWARPFLVRASMYLGWEGLVN